MSAQNTLVFDLRKWEAQTSVKFSSIQGSGTNWVEIKLPPSFIYGSYIHLRDLVFQYGNLYDCVGFQYLDVFGAKEHTLTIHLSMLGTLQGKCIFIDEVLRPIYNHRYYFRLTDIPSIPEEYGLFHKLHYRIITKQRMAEEGKSNEDFFLSRLITRQRAEEYWKFLNEPVKPSTQPAPIYKYVCYVCKKMFDLKHLYTFTLDRKKHHICQSCYDSIPLTTMDQITLRKV